MRNKQEIIKALKAIRETVCCYLGPLCDCKFGVNEKKLVRLPNGQLKHDGLSEQTGCPELYVTIAILEKMTDEEWEIYNGNR